MSRTPAAHLWGDMSLLCGMSDVRPRSQGINRLIPQHQIVSRYASDQPTMTFCAYEQTRDYPRRHDVRKVLRPRDARHDAAVFSA